jgi:hypothetical protein
MSRLSMKDRSSFPFFLPSAFKAAGVNDRIVVVVLVVADGANPTVNDGNRTNNASMATVTVTMTVERTDRRDGIIILEWRIGFCTSTDLPEPQQSFDRNDELIVDVESSTHIRKYHSPVMT